MKILVADDLSDAGLEVLRSIRGATVDVKIGLKEDGLLAIAGDYEAMVVRSGAKITAKVIEAAAKLKAVARAGIGYDNIDLETATKKGVVVMNTPGKNAVTTAEHTIAMLMAVSRNIPQAHATLKGGKWSRKEFMGTELAGKVLGLVGLGNVGREVAHRAHGLGMEVVAHDPYIAEKTAKEMGVRLLSLDEIYKTSDFLSLHTVLTDATRHMVGREAFAKMKNRIRIVNCARGGLIDEAALLEALDSGKVAGAALDVFEEEPPPKGYPLIGHARVVVTPHLGASTDEAQEQVALAAAEQIKTYLEDDVVVNGVNVPSVSREVLRAIGNYIDLGEKLGLFLGQTGLEGVWQVSVETAGEITKYDVAPITSAALKGLMAGIGSEAVNFVNAPVIARERGVRIVESKSADAGNYVNLVTVKVSGKNGSHEASGSVFGKESVRIVRFDNYTMEVVPKGHLLLIQNEDKPGVVGAWGTILGKNRINISRVQLALDDTNQLALSLVNIDTPAPKNVIDELSKVANVQSVRQVRL